MKSSDFENFIPQNVVKACKAYKTDEDGGARASLEFYMDGNLSMHIRTDNSHWNRRVALDAYLQDSEGAWMPGLAWLG